jgi:hypothetical protein
MLRKVAGSVLGAVVVFVWMGISWMVLPWHTLDYKSFNSDGQAMVGAIASEAPASGLYMIPNFSGDNQQDKAKHQAWAEKAKQGPFVFMNIRKEGTMWDMNTALAVEFVIILLGAFMIAWMLSKVLVQGIMQRAVFVMIAATAGTFLANASHWNWWAFPIGTTAINIVDVAIGWFFAGLVMAKIVR